MNKLTARNIVLIWLAWVLIVLGFQALAMARLQLQWPDHAQSWTVKATGTGYQDGHPYLLEPFMNNQVAWDSEYYLGIAVRGYDNPCIPALNNKVPGGGGVRCTDTKNPAAVWDAGKSISLSYAFFPFYPLMIRLFALPLGLFLKPIAAAVLAGVIVSALGTLAGMLALYDLTYESLGEEGGMRAVFYLLIFPTSFFLVQVYTEGLFVGLAFACLAMLRRKHLVYAALLGMAATLTRPVGVALVIPMAISWIRTNEWYALDQEWRQLYYQRLPWRPFWHGLLAFAPLIVFLIWKFSYYGFAFDYVEGNFFGRAFMDMGSAFGSWGISFSEMIAGFLHVKGPPVLHFFVHPQHSAYYFTEFLGMAIGLIAILRCLKTHPELAWFSLAVFLISWGSGSQGIHRYVLGAPAVFIGLARWGKNPVFDRAWTLASILLMGLLAMLYTFNFWVA